ncbi:MAG: AAA domain-containing protein [Fimbriiglobus sp.]
MATLQLDRLPRNATPGEVLRFVCTRGKVDRTVVGRISFLGNGAIVNVPESQAVRLVAALDGATFRDYPVRVRLTSALTQPDAAQHFGHFTHLLQLEADAEREQFERFSKSGVEADGTSLSKLIVREEDIALGGRFVVTLTRGKGATPLPPNRLQPGSPVVMTQTGVSRPSSFRGVLVERRERYIIVALEESEDDRPDDASWRLDLSPDEAARQRQLAALNRAGAATGDRLAELRAVLLGQRRPNFDPHPMPGVSVSLNEPQQAAVNFALSAQDLAVIHGPPGTGKTTTLVELIRRAVENGARVLACAPSNAAVDNMLDKLLKLGLLPVRIGHPARIAEELRDRAIDTLVERHPEARQARKYTKEARELLAKANKWTKVKPAPGERSAWRAEARELLALARRAEQNATERILADARIICGTLTGIDSERLGQLRYDLLVIDEACQSPEPACWIPILRANRVVLAGDPCQLPPTVISQEAAEEGLAVSMMERVMALHGAAVSRLLTVQYRMHETIMGFSNAEFYGGELVADETVAKHTLADLEGVTRSPLTETPAKFINTAGASYDEAQEEDTASRYNPQEADLVIKYVNQLLSEGVKPEVVAVISPYNGQVRYIREKLGESGIEVDSVDGFQGREKEVILISLVRSNPDGQIGFLSDVRRTNVALTRARRKLIVIGDTATLSNHDFYQRLSQYFETTDSYASVWEEM